MREEEQQANTYLKLCECSVVEQKKTQMKKVHISETIKKSFESLDGFKKDSESFFDSLMHRSLSRVEL